MADAVLTRDGPVSVPLDYVVPQGGELSPLTVRAVIDGTSAASSFYAVTEVISPSGRSMGKYITGAIAAGASADVTWFPGVGGLGGAATQALVGARIHATATQTVPSNSNTNLVYQTVDFDTDGMANLGSDARKLTVNTPGLYMVICNTQWVYNNAGRRLNAICQNDFFSTTTGAQATDGQMAVWAPVGGEGGGSPHTANTSVAILQAQVGDFFTSGCFQKSGGNLDCGGSSTAERNDSSFAAILIAGPG